jgi:hypothetical protein
MGSFANTMMMQNLPFPNQSSAQGPMGSFNVPNNLFGQQGFMPTGFSGYNANNANILQQPQNTLGPQMAGQYAMGYGQPQNGPSQFNPYSMMMGGGQQGYGMPQQQSYGGGYPGYQQPGNGFNPSQLNPSSIEGQIASGQGAGAAVNTLPAWQQGVQAQQYNIQQGADNLAEQFNNAGGLFSNAYGSAAGQYQTQATLGENAQLSQSQLQALESAQGYQNQAATQYSSQGLQAQMGLMQDQLGVAGLGMQSATGLGNLYNTNLENSANIANLYPQQQYTPGWLTSMMSGLGGMAQGAGSIMQGLPYV